MLSSGLGSRGLISRATQLSPRLRRVFDSASIGLILVSLFRSAAKMVVRQIDEISPEKGNSPERIIIVDDSNEGNLASRYFQGISQLAEELEIPAERIMVLTQNETFWHSNSRALTAGPVNWSVLNRQFHVACVVANRRRKKPFHRPWPIRDRHRFLPLNNIPRPHRFVLAALMNEADRFPKRAVLFHMCVRTLWGNVTSLNERMEAILALVNELGGRRTTPSFVRELNAVVRTNHDSLVGVYINHKRRGELRTLPEAIDRAGLLRSDEVHNLKWNGSLEVSRCHLMGDEK